MQSVSEKGLRAWVIKLTVGQVIYEGLETGFIKMNIELIPII
jgi:hypothetical protein